MTLLVGNDGERADIFTEDLAHTQFRFTDVKGHANGLCHICH